MQLDASIHLAAAVAVCMACSDAPPASSPVDPLSTQSFQAHGTPYSAVGDCANAILVDPGIVRIVDGVLIQRRTILHCPLSGDIEGVVELVQNLDLRNPGTPEVEGRVFGTTELLIDRFFGRTDLEGTFFGPFDSSLENLLFGELKIVRRGTGDFSGMVMRGTAVQDPPGSAVEVENGEISAGDVR